LLWRLRAGLNIMYQYKAKIASVPMMTVMVPDQKLDILCGVHGPFRK